jgi:hypothetical protein
VFGLPFGSWDGSRLGSDDSLRIRCCPTRGFAGPQGSPKKSTNEIRGRNAPAAHPFPRSLRWSSYYCPVGLGVTESPCRHHKSRQTGNLRLLCAFLIGRFLLTLYGQIEGAPRRRRLRRSSWWRSMSPTSRRLKTGWRSAARRPIRKGREPRRHDFQWSSGDIVLSVTVPFILRIASLVTLNCRFKSWNRAVIAVKSRSLPASSIAAAVC